MAVVGPFLQLGYVAYAAMTGEAGAQLPLITALTGVELGLLFAWYRRCAEHYLGVGPLHFFLLPLGSLTVSVLYTHSAWMYLTKHKVSWKGRKYLVNTSKSIEEEGALPLSENLTPAPTEPGS
jgi:hypothetical protein